MGPFCHLRPAATWARGAKIGNFVELKKPRIGRGAKVPHLSYVGDADRGRRRQHRRRHDHLQLRRRDKTETISATARSSAANASLVAPVSVGDGAYVGAAR